MKPNSRLPWAESNTSTTSAQKTDTTNRLNTLVHTKNEQSIQKLRRVAVNWSSAANTSRLSAKKRYAIVMNRLRGSRATRAANAGLIAIIAPSVPRNSHGSFSIPWNAPTSSRTGLRIEYEHITARMYSHDQPSARTSPGRTSTAQRSQRARRASAPVVASSRPSEYSRLDAGPIHALSRAVSRGSCGATVGVPTVAKVCVTPPTAPAPELRAYQTFPPAPAA